MWAVGGRIIGSFVTLLAVSIVLFVLVHTIPVSPARVVLGIDASEADIAEFDRDHGLDQPLWRQYAAWIGNAARGDFGKSIIDETSISRLGLTPREVEVLTLVAVGRTNREIGAELFVSEKTAGVHVSNILRKLGVTSRVDAAAVAQRLGGSELAP